MQICRLNICTLLKGQRSKVGNGTYVTEYQELGSYKMIPQELLDQVSASIYGANINKTIRISSVRRKLELLLSIKVNNKADNISSYFIKYDNKIYKIVSVKINWIDIEAISEAKNGSV